mgnify:CR=1 FL=1
MSVKLPRIPRITKEQIGDKKYFPKEFFKSLDYARYVRLKLILSDILKDLVLHVEGGYLYPDETWLFVTDGGNVIRTSIDELKEIGKQYDYHN